MFAVCANKLDVAQWLQAHHPQDVNVYTSVRVHCLRRKRRISCPNCVALQYGYSALMYACWAGHLEMSQWLYSLGADPYNTSGKVQRVLLQLALYFLLIRLCNV